MKQKLLLVTLISILLISGCRNESGEPADTGVPETSEPVAASAPPGAETATAPPTLEPLVSPEPEQSSAPAAGENAGAVMPSVSLTAAEMTGSMSADGADGNLVEWRAAYPNVISANAEAASVINGYYENVSAKLKDYASSEVYDLALESWESDPDGFGGPFRIEMNYSVRYNGNDMLSVTRESVEELYPAGTDGTPEITFQSETFDTKSGGLLVMSDFFTVEEQVYRARLLACIAVQLGDEAQNAELMGALEAGFNRDSFYITDNGIVVYYQPYELGPDYEKVTEFAIPYSEILDILATK